MKLYSRTPLLKIVTDSEEHSRKPRVFEKSQCNFKTIVMFMLLDKWAIRYLEAPSDHYQVNLTQAGNR